MGEFDIIREFFSPKTTRAILGVGDDCALLQIPPHSQLAISSDMLVCGRHFFPDIDPEDIGYKALAVNLSDLAACGARPISFTLALALPNINHTWLKRFSQGLLSLADLHDCELIGGDTTCGPLNICISIFGEIPNNQALLRSGARIDDDLYVSGNLGDANLALRTLLNGRPIKDATLAACRKLLNRPTPRVQLGIALRTIATAAIDLSDGFLGDGQHLLNASNVGAMIDSNALLSCMQTKSSEDLCDDTRIECILSGGDDYELLFTAPVKQRAAVLHAAQISQTPVTRIGHITPTNCMALSGDYATLDLKKITSFDHFFKT
jgi:thiamine-monophosphate kinase